MNNEEPTITLILTRDEFQQLIYALAMFHHAVTVAPIVNADQGNRSDRMRKRRLVERFNARIQDLGKAYGMDLG